MSSEWVIDGFTAPSDATLYGVSDKDWFPSFYKWEDEKLYGRLAEGDDEWSHCPGAERSNRRLASLQHRPSPRITAHEFLERGIKHMCGRAVQRDSDAGERSMARAVAAFNAQEGTNLTEAQGWRFMIQLKYARAVNGVFVADDYEDMAAYAGLAGEAAQ